MAPLQFGLGWAVLGDTVLLHVVQVEAEASIETKPLPNFTPR